MPRIKAYKELKRIMARHYLLPRVGRYLGRKVAWVTSGAPVEPLVALGITPMYPENHGAICGARKVAPESHALAEGAGYNAELCSYARVDLGVQMGGPSPVKGLAKPDMMVACNNICNTVSKWFERSAELQGVPLFIVDTPMIHDELEEHTLDYVEEQMRALFDWAQEISGNTIGDDELIEVGRIAQENIETWTRLLECNIARPALFSCFDAFVLMLPIVSMRGRKSVTKLYERVIKEMEANRAAGRYLLKDEKHRLIWDNIPVWFAIGSLARFLKEHDTALVADTYTHAWAGHAIDMQNPWRGLAQAYTDIYLNQSIPYRIDRVAEMLDRFDADGFIMHSNRSCKPYSLGEYLVKDEVTKRTGKPGVVIEGDMTDPRYYTESQTTQRLQALIESL